MEKHILQEHKYAAIPFMEMLLTAEECIVKEYCLEATESMLVTIYVFILTHLAPSTMRCYNGSISKLGTQITCGTCHVGLWNLFFTRSNAHGEERSIYCDGCSVNFLKRNAQFIWQHTTDIRRQFTQCCNALCNK